MGRRQSGEGCGCAAVHVMRVGVGCVSEWCGDLSFLSSTVVLANFFMCASTCAFILSALDIAEDAAETDGTVTGEGIEDRERGRRERGRRERGKRGKRDRRREENERGRDERGVAMSDRVGSRGGVVVLCPTRRSAVWPLCT